MFWWGGNTFYNTQIKCHGKFVICIQFPLLMQFVHEIQATKLIENDEIPWKIQFCQKKKLGMGNFTEYVLQPNFYHFVYTTRPLTCQTFYNTLHFYSFSAILPEFLTMYCNCNKYFMWSNINHPSFLLNVDDKWL